MSKFIPTRSGNPCFCGDTSGKCRENQDGTFYCMNFADSKFGEVVNGYKCICQASAKKSYFASLWALNDSAERSEEKRRESERKREERRLEEAREIEERRSRSLSPKERDKGYRALFAQLELHPGDRADLVRRGLSDDLIKKSEYRSVSRYQRLKTPINPNLPGTDDGTKLLNSGDGLLLPIRDINGLIVSYDLRLRNPVDGNRYRNPGGDNVLHLFPTPDSKGEPPIAVFRKPETPLLYLTEGRSFKPLLTSERFGVNVIGASGGQFLASPVLFREALEEILQRDKWVDGVPSVRIAIDAGDVLNPVVMTRWKALFNQLEEWNITPVILWWGQVTKEDPDIDENPTKIKEYTLSDWLELAEKLKEKHERANKKTGNSQRRVEPKIQAKTESKTEEKPDNLAGEASSKINELIKEIRQAKLTWKPNLEVNQKYLSVTLPTKGLNILKGKWGTGKSTLFKSGASDCISEGTPVLLPTHRIALGRALASEMGLTWIDESDSVEDVLMKFLALVIDSLHPYGKAKFNWEDWAGATIYIDEVEQFLKHSFSSSTCAKKRSLILQTLSQLLNYVIETGGCINCADADASDLSVNYLYNVLGKKVKPFIIVNHHEKQPFPVVWYTGKTPAALLAEAKKMLAQGKRVMFLTDTQKESGAYSSYNLESELKKDFPQLSVMRVDAKTLQDPTNAAYGSLANLNLAAKGYMVVIFSPSCNTGLSLELFDHYDAVFLISKGVLNAYDLHQFLWRLRDSNVPRHIWVKERGITAHQGSIFAKEIVQKQLQKVAKSISIQLSIPVESIDLSKACDPIHTRFAAQFIARDNASKLRLREHLLELLIENNHEIQFAEIDKLSQRIDQLKTEESGLVAARLEAESPEEKDEISSAIAAIENELQGIMPRFMDLDSEQEEQHEKQKAIKNENKEKRYEDTATEKLLDDTEGEALDKSKTKTRQQDLQLDKWKAHKKYGGVDVTKELIKLDNTRNYYTKLRRHYYLTHKPEYLRMRDLSHLGKRLNPLKNMNEPVSLNFPVTLNDVRLWTGEVNLLQKLNVIELLETSEDISVQVEKVERFKESLKANRDEIKEFFGVTIPDDEIGIREVNGILKDAIGVALSRVSSKKEKIYVFKGLKDGDPRQAIFAKWAEEDEKRLAEFNEAEATQDFYLVVNGMQKPEVTAPTPAPAPILEEAKPQTKLICINGSLEEVPVTPVTPVTSVTPAVTVAKVALAAPVTPVTPVTSVEEAIAKVNAKPEFNPESLIGKAVKWFSEYANKVLDLGRIQAIDSMENGKVTYATSEGWFPSLDDLLNNSRYQIA